MTNYTEDSDDFDFDTLLIELNPLIIDKSKIDEGLYSEEEIYSLEIEGQVLGPFYQEDLKEFILNHELPTETKVKLQASEDWKLIYQHPLFQRRKPQLVSNQTLNTQEEIYILRDGQKEGPISMSELKQLVEDKELIMTDMISTDSGVSFGRLHEMSEFDRRTIQHSDLPHLPQWEVFKKSNDEVTENLREHEENQDNTDAIAGLAFIENIKAGKAIIIETDEQFVETSQSSEETEMPSAHEISKFYQKKWFYPSLFSMSIVGLIFVLTMGPSKRSQEMATATSKSASRSIASKPQTNSFKSKKGKSSWGAKKKVRPSYKSKKSPRRSKSFTKSKRFKSRDVFKKKKLKDNPYEDENDDYYYDDQDPVQLDPIRKKISKENLDPENSFFNDEEQDLFDSARSPASKAWPDPDHLDEEPFDEEIEL